MGSTMTAAMVEASCSVDDALQLVGEMRAPFRLAAGEGLLGAVIGVRQVVDARQQRAEELAVVDDAADRDAAEADAVIAALAADQARLAALALHVPVGERDLQRRIDGLGARIAEEDVVEVAGRELGDARGELEAPSHGRTGRPANSRARPPAPGWPPRSRPGCGPALQHHRPAAPSITSRPSGRDSSACPSRGRSCAGAA